MMDLLLVALLVGLAVSACIEFIDMILEFVAIPISKGTIKKIFVLPLSVGGTYLMHVSLPEIVVISWAAFFISLCITLWLDKPIVIQNNTSKLVNRRALDGLL